MTDFTKGEQELRDKIRDKCYYNGAGRMAETYADAIIGIPQVKASSDTYEALLTALGAITALDNGKEWLEGVYAEIQQALAKAESTQ